MHLFGSANQSIACPKRVLIHMNPRAMGPAPLRWQNF